MILPKYEPNFLGLTSGQAVYLAQHMSLPEADTLSGPDIFQIANHADMDQADVVMTLATDPSLLGVQVVEALIGRPIVRRAAKSPVSRGPGRRTVTVRRSDPRHIVYVLPDNPKKGASRARFALYREGMTIDEFLAAGGTMGDVKWDAERGFIRLEGDPS